MSSTVKADTMEPMDVAAPVDAAAPRLLDERAFHALYAQTAAPLRAYIVRSMGSPDHADDIVQDTFLRVLRKPVPVVDEELRAYVFRVASNLVVDHWRAHKREATNDVPEQASDAPDQSTRLDVGRMFGQLKPRERQMLWLAHVEGASHKEIAAALGLGTTSIRVLLSRARGRLARLLHDRSKEQA